MKLKPVTLRRLTVAAAVLLTAAVLLSIARQQASAWDASKFEKPGDAALRQSLTPMQYEVTQQQGTEPSFRNPYWNNHQVGIYVDVVSGEPLFSSLDKYDSGTGWPSFTKPLEPNNIVRIPPLNHTYLVWLMPSPLKFSQAPSGQPAASAGSR